jgi:hypothetical protein
MRSLRVACPQFQNKKDNNPNYPTTIAFAQLKPALRHFSKKVLTRIRLRHIVRAPNNMASRHAQNKHYKF